MGAQSRSYLHGVPKVSTFTHYNKCTSRIVSKPLIVRLANSKAGIKPTAPLSAFDKKNSIEFPLDSVHYLYKQSNPNPVLLSCASL